MQHIMIVGIQGSGKWTQCQKILGKYPEYVLFETGQELRKIAKIDTPVGRDIRDTLAAWKLVKTEQIKDILTDFLSCHPNTPILFDSIIRSKEQNDILWPLIPQFSVIFLELNEETALRRLSGRRIDPETNEIFPAEFKGDANPKTGNKLVTRSDDTPESIRSRISWSIHDTLPLIWIWRSEGHQIYTIDASESVENVFHEIDTILSAEKKKQETVKE